MKKQQRQIPIIDLFAGPGGLGEGFSAYQTQDGHSPFKIALSIEKEAFAHRTLTLRAFFREFAPGNAPQEYYDYLQKTDEAEPIRRKKLFDAWPIQAEAAKRTALCMELGAENTLQVRKKINEALNGAEEFILLGGPPCQAYSLMGRSRNSGNPDYKPTKDRRQKLYVEYLQVLADHAPTVFIMENVKGLISAKLRNQHILKRILDDLGGPCEAIRREGRELADGRRRTHYDLFAIGNVDNYPDSNLRRFLVKMERHGIPQARHRLIIVGIKRGIGISTPETLSKSDQINIGQVLNDLPSVRSGLSRTEDSPGNWLRAITAIKDLDFMKSESCEVDGEILTAIKDALRKIAGNDLTRGGEFMQCLPNTKYQHDWFVDPLVEGMCNHTPKQHMKSDLHRYLFAACFAEVHGLSPKLKDFPQELLPKHKNTKKALTVGHFSDRFHVQVKEHPASTVTSHLSKDGHFFIHYDPVQCRSMTVREAARLQTFPDNYYFCGPRTAQYIQVGNAVPPLLARQIAKIIHDALGVNPP